MNNSEGQTQEPVGGMKDEIISKRYDEFFGTGYWERDYKKHIVLFARGCVEALTPPPAPIKTEGEDESDFDLLAEYDMKERAEKIVTHAFDKVPEDNKRQFLINFINGIVGSAILHHNNRYVKKLNVPDFKTTFK